VRQLLIISVFVLAAGSWLRGQDQERKLFDRLLKPDMTLQNSEQKKKFIADKTPIDKKANVRTFYVNKKSKVTKFSNQRSVSEPQFDSHAFPGNPGAFKSSSQHSVGNSRTYPTQPAPGAPSSSQSEKKVSSRGYAGNRPFLDQGKSQKSLNRQNAPLTIDQVRELLNKNK